MTGPGDPPDGLQPGDLVQFVNPDGTPGGDYLVTDVLDDGTPVLTPLLDEDGRP